MSNIQDLLDRLRSPASYEGGPMTDGDEAAMEIVHLRQRNSELELRQQKHDKICDSNFVRGMTLGWNLCVDDNREELNRIAEQHTKDKLDWREKEEEQQ